MAPLSTTSCASADDRAAAARRAPTRPHAPAAPRCPRRLAKARIPRRTPCISPTRGGSSHPTPPPQGRNRMIRFNVRAVATAGLAVALLASTAATAAAAEGSADEKSPLEAAISAYQRVYPKITLDAATRAASQQEARKALYDALPDKTFAGAWFDPQAGVLHIAATDDATAKRAQE